MSQNVAKLTPKPRRLCYTRGMGGIIKIAICVHLCNLWTVTSLLGGNVDLSALSPDNIYDTAVWTNGGFRNLDRTTDARYTGMIGHVSQGARLRIVVEVTLNPSNVVSICFGNAGEGSGALLVECREGVWEMRCRGQRHRFDAPVPPLQAGRNTYRLSFVASPWGGGYAPEVRVSVNGGDAVRADHIAPPKSMWGRLDPSGWDKVWVAVRGDGEVNEISCEWGEPGSLIIVR